RRARDRRALRIGGRGGAPPRGTAAPQALRPPRRKTVVSIEEFTAKIRAAAEARTDPDLVIIARTDAIAVHGFDDALKRAEAASRAGADMLFVEAPTDEKQIEAIARAIDTPLLFNYAPGGRSPLLPF